MSSDGDSQPVVEKTEVIGADVVKTDHVDHYDGTHRIATKEQIPGHVNYYERDGLRTYGDGLDHDHEPPVCSIQAL
jgi:hypothetical protein